MEEVPARVIAKITCSIPGKGKLRIYQNAKITIHQIKCSISEKLICILLIYYRKMLPKWTEKVRISPERGLEGPQDDVYSWRKYGQKDILGAKFPR